MILDKLLQLSEKQTITTTAYSTNVVDTGAADRAIGDVTSLTAIFSITTAVTGGTSVAFEVQDCATEGGTYVTRASSGAIAVAGLGLGTEIQVKLPSNLARFVRANYTVVGSPSTGKASAHIVLDANRIKAYPDGL